MHRFIQAKASLTQRCRGQHTDRACKHSCFITQNITEHILSYDNVKAGRTTKQLHCTVVNKHMLQLNIRIIRSNTNDNFTPQTGGFEYVSLINRSELLAAFLSDFKGLTNDTFNFFYIVSASIYSFLSMLSIATIFLTEVNAACKLTNNDQISTFKYFRFQGRGILQAVEYDSRAKIREQAKRFANAQQASLRTELFRISIPFRSTNCTKQNCICALTYLQSLLRKWSSLLINSNPAKESMLCFKTVSEQFLCTF
ncbi:hypothetical protein D3C78_1245280 [compost metagenome]